MGSYLCCDPVGVATPMGKEESEDETELFATDQEVANDLIDRLKDSVTEIPSTKEPEIEKPLTEEDLLLAVKKALKGQGKEAKLYLINKLVTRERRKFKRDNVKDLYRFVKILVTSLTQADQQELEEILADLPPAALGDEQARNESRVLTNILDDTRNAISISTKAQKDCQPTYQHIEELLKDRDYSQARFCHTLFSRLSKGEKFRVVLAQLLLSQVLPPQKEERQTLFKYLFRSGSKEKV